MAPSRTKKNKISMDSEASTRQQPITVALPAVTPQQSPQKRIMRITENQKQALIDNLQLEVTERARKLRAQYALQAQSLRTRIELRVNRIPKTMRMANMGELLAHYEDMQERNQKAAMEGPAKKTAPELVAPVQESQIHNAKAAPRIRGTKRTSDAMESEDKGNIIIHEDPIPNPKKRTKTARDLQSRHPPNSSTVLSPKSNNSRTLPQSPVLPTMGSPQKPFHSRPASPLKPASSPTKTNVAAAAAATASLASMITEKPKPGRPKAAPKVKRAPHGKEETDGLRTVSSTSNSSAMSTGTTIVKNTKKAPATMKKSTGTKATGKKLNAPAEPPPAGRRNQRLTSEMNENTNPEDMFRPPVNRAMRVLDRPFFKKNVSVVAAKVQDLKHISKLRSQLSRDILGLDRMQIIQNVPDADGQVGKAILLKPEISYRDPSTWSPILTQLVEAGEVKMMPFNIDLDYDYWDYHDVMSSIMPEDLKDDFPTGFSVVGHIVHLNLHGQHLPYKNLIATVLLDKVRNARTVINKIDDVGSTNVYRTFRYELLAGDPDLNVELNEEGCTFRFDYSKVYWNSRLNTEHSRLVESFQPGEAICDVMAGVGPFAVPAGKKRCWVMANDLNPDSFTSLQDAVKRNKVGNFVLPYNDDGRTFIISAAEELLANNVVVDVTPPAPRSSRKDPQAIMSARQNLQRPRTFAHYVLNLPASALSFLPSFIGLYARHEELFAPHTEARLPLIHVYCFNSKSDSNEEAEQDICEEISNLIGFQMSSGSAEIDGQVSIWDVRDVAPKKRMFCASFRLPAEVAFTDR